MKNLSRNKIFIGIVIGIVLFSMVIPFTALAAGGSHTVTFKTANDVGRIQARTISLWNVDAKLTGDAGKDQLYINELKEKTKAELTTELGTPYATPEGQVVNQYIITAALPQGSYVAYDEVMTVDGKVYHGFLSFNVPRDTADHTLSSKVELDDNPPPPSDNPPGDFHFRKVSATDRQPLSGASFVLTRKIGDAYERVQQDGKDIVLLSDDRGNFSATGLPYETYYLWEINAPQGYKLLTEPIKVEIGPDTAQLVLEIENVKDDVPPPPSDNPPDVPEPSAPEPSKPGITGQIPKTGDITFIMMCVVGMLLIGLGISIIRSEQRYNSH